MDILDKQNVYLVPLGDGSGKIAIDLVEIIKAEQRLRDVATVNQFTAPELLSTFNETWLELNRSVTQLSYQKNACENHYKTAMADAKLSCTDEYLRTLGHSKGSADLRNAVVQKNPEVQATKERLDEISFVLETLRGKMDAFFQAYNSVKKLTDSRTLPGQKYGDANRPEIFASPPKQVPVERQVEQDPDLQPLPPGFGSGRY